MRPPGIYAGVPMGDYHADDALSRSRLVRLLDDTPAAFKSGVSIDETPAMRLGTALHLAILEPDRFAELVRPMPKYDGRTREGKAGKVTWGQLNPGKIAVPEDEYAQAVAAAAMVRKKHGPATALREGRAELSMWWDGPDGVELRCRPDFCDLDRGIVVDVKSTSRGLGDREIVRFLTDHHAAMQAAMILDAVFRLTGKSVVHGMHLLVVDLSADPIDMRLVEIGEDWLLYGEQQFQTALRTYRECKLTDTWPSWADKGVTRVPMPAWIRSRSEREATDNFTTTL